MFEVGSNPEAASLISSERNMATENLVVNREGRDVLLSLYLKSGKNQKAFCRDKSIPVNAFSDIVNGKALSAQRLSNVFEPLGLNYLKYVIDQGVEEEASSTTSLCHSIIKNKIRSSLQDGFVGRRYVFKAFEKFINDRNKGEVGGYFSVVGFPGEGKSAIAAHYVTQINPDCVYHFNWKGKIHTASQFLENICYQIRSKYPNSIPPSNDAWGNGLYLESLLFDVSEHFLQPKAELLVIVVDALDEADPLSKSNGTNILKLPDSLPPNVYFFLTQRPTRYKEYELEPQNRQDVSFEAYYLQDVCRRGNDDIREYICQYLNRRETPILANLQGGRITKQNGRNASKNDFVSVLVKASNANFMYVKYILYEFSQGTYQSIEPESLPRNLEEYYRDHWNRMQVESGLADIVAKIALYHIPPTANDIVKATGRLHQEVLGVLTGWAQFLKKNDDEPTGYFFYHESYREFLSEQDVVKLSDKDLFKHHDEMHYSAMGGDISDGGYRFSKKR